MANLGEPSRLLAGELNPKLFYIEQHQSPKNIIITTGGRHVSVYDVNDSQPECSWTLISGHTLTKGAVLNPQDGRYAAVVDSKVVRLWNKSDPNIHKSKKITMSKPVHGLITRGCFQPLVVYADGSLAWLSSSSEFISSPCMQDNEQLDCVKAILVKNELILIMISQIAGKSGRFIVFVIKENSESVQGRPVPTKVDSSSPQCRCLRANGANVTLLTLDSSGSFSEMHLTGSLFGQTTQLTNVPVQGKGQTICSLGSTHVAICGLLSPTTGKACLGVWDTKFGTVQTWKPLPVEPSEQEQMVLYCHGKQVLVVCTKGLYIYSFSSRQSTLGAALGKFSTTCMEVSQEPALTEISNLLKKLSCSEKTKTHKQFSAAFNAFTKELDQQETDVLDVQNLMAAVIKRCLSEKTFWAKDEIHLLIKRSMVPLSMITGLMEALIKHNDLELIGACLENLQDIPETALRECLNFVMRTEDVAFKEFGKTKWKGVDSSTQPTPELFGSEKARFVTMVLAVPFNEAFLAGQLKNVDFDNCLSLLQHLHWLLKTNQVGGSEKSKEVISLIKVVDWINLLLDAHFAQMVLSPEAHHILVDLHQTVEGQVQYYNELSGLESILAQIKEKCSLPQKQNLGLYNIHVLHVY